jgi:hypothetical protein
MITLPNKSRKDDYDKSAQESFNNACWRVRFLYARGRCCGALTFLVSGRGNKKQTIKRDDFTRVA